MSDAAQPLSSVLRDEYVRLHGPLPADTVAAIEAADAAADAALGTEDSVAAARAAAESAKLKAIYAAIHALDEEHARTALCISGGGIRSATFALGVMQRLAAFGLLSRFHYLSTVSGGGYIGSWLSSFVRRNPGGIAEVEKQISGAAPATRDPLRPEVEPLVWLRRFSNYLTPKLGIMSGDTWAFAGSYLRNLLLIWLIFVPLLAAVLALPRLTMSLLRLSVAGGYLPALSAGGAVAMILVATLVIAAARPVSYRHSGWLTNERFHRYVLFPYFSAAVLLVLYWSARYDAFDDWWLVFAGFIAITTVASIVYIVRFFRTMRRERRGNVRADSTKTRYAWKKVVMETVAAAAAGSIAAGLLYGGGWIFNDPLTAVALPTLESWKSVPPDLSTAPGALFLCFGVPLVLGVLFVQAAVFVGIASWFNEEYDREWWGRAAGWVLLAGLAWIVAAAIAVYGPVAIYEAPRLFAAITGGTGLVAILVGRSGITSATAKEQDESRGAASKGTGIALGMIAPVFAVCVLALISLCTSEILLAIQPPGRIAPDELAVAAAGSYQIRREEPLAAAGEAPATRTFETSQFPAAEEDRIAAIEHLWTIDHTTLPVGLALVFGPALFSWFVAFFIGANQFSMHGLYRNRLIRGYLGASRYSRRPNRFSGFDPNDDLPVHRLRPELVWSTSFIEIAKHAPAIVADPDVAPFIEETTNEAVKAAAADPQNDELRREASDLLADDLNRAIDSLALGGDPQLPQPVLNRLALEARFPGALQPMKSHRQPLHVIGMTLNLVDGDNLAWQERKAASFAVSPIYSGGLRVGYRPTQRYGGPSGISVGTAVAISGAAASPNMGYNSSPALSFLLTLFNVRLGWWLGNPKKDTYGDQNPTNTLHTIVDEAIGATDDEHDYVYLSDGGHFENLGLYEMVLRRCRCIVVSDAGADPEFGFEDLGNAIRKIRIDLGIDIVVKEMALFPRSAKDPSHAKYCAVAEIRYGDVDPGAKPGRLLYLKPAFYGAREPKDVYNYASTYGSFPHQSTGDQFFSESQFESYRQLGYFAVGEVANGQASFVNVCELIDEAERYIEKK